MTYSRDRFWAIYFRLSFARPSRTWLSACLLALALPACSYRDDLSRNDTLWTVSQFGGATGTPYADEDVAAFVVAFSDLVVGVDSRTGDPLWQTRVELPSFAPGGNNSPFMEFHRVGETLIFASHALYALDRLSGELQWSFKLPDDLPGRWSVVVGDILVGTGKRIYWIDPETGTELSRTDKCPVSKVSRPFAGPRHPPALRWNSLP